MAKQETKEVVVNENRVARALAKHLRISPRKLRLVIDTVRYMPVGKAFDALMFLKQKGARMTEKLLKSAVANAKVLGMDEGRLYVAAIFANGGPVFKRFMSRSMGRADRILKRTSHLSIVLKEGRKSYAKPEAPGAKQEKGKMTKPKKKALKAGAGKS